MVLFGSRRFFVTKMKRINVSYKSDMVTPFFRYKDETLFFKTKNTGEIISISFFQNELIIIYPNN